MDSNNLIQIIINLSQASGPVQKLMTGMAYLLGIIFVFIGIVRLYSISAALRNARGSQNSFVPLAYIVGGAALFYIPTTFHVLSATVFGEGSVLQYASVNPVNIIPAIILLIQTVGLIWFIRGCVLLVASSEPGVQEGPKGMVFIFAGILAMNFETTIAVLSTLITELATLF